MLHELEYSFICLSFAWKRRAFLRSMWKLRYVLVWKVDSETCYKNFSAPYWFATGLEEACALVGGGLCIVIHKTCANQRDEVSFMQVTLLLLEDHF